MIKINLLGQEAAKDNTAAIQIGAYFGSLGLIIVIAMLLLRSLNSGIAQTKAQVDQKEVELANLKKVTKEVHDLEKKKVELKDKLLVIASLKSRKVGPVRVLDDLNMALPEKSWLAELKESSGAVNIQGLALDNQTVATFMKGLEGSDYFSNIELVETRQAEWQKVSMKKFTLSAKLRYGGKRELEEKPDAQKKGSLDPAALTAAFNAEEAQS